MPDTGALACMNVGLTVQFFELAEAVCRAVFSIQRKPCPTCRQVGLLSLVQVGDNASVCPACVVARPGSEPPGPLLCCWITDAGTSCKLQLRALDCVWMLPCHLLQLFPCLGRP